MTEIFERRKIPTSFKISVILLSETLGLKNAYGLEKELFPQPEGITFSPDGRPYTSSEGKKDTKATISKMELPVK